MDAQRFFIVDVFAEAKYSGNQLAVFLNGHLYSDREMQHLAHEMNFSETTFILPHDNRDGAHRVRIFTPVGELPFAGHPTLGTAYIIATELSDTPVAGVTLDLNAGRIPVTLERDAAGAIRRLTMRQLPPTFGPPLDPARIAAVLDVPVTALDLRYPVQEVSTGLPFLIVPLQHLSDVRAIRSGGLAAAALAQGLADHAVLVFCRETYDPAHQLNVRVFVPHMGIAEDPATGSAGGCLTGYLVQHGYFGPNPFAIQAEQGYEVQRPSLLYLAGARADDAITIQVGGSVQLIAEGRLR
ncbi:MAG: PhzF family phenazine biosynthesis protein [Chloroflexota bacterium]|nr:PhzF family phenazine biosynthesis protein [Chloroflexota bacterium]